MNTEAIKTAVEWWADKLRGCKQSGLNNEERQNGQNRGYEMAEMLMTINKPKVSDEQIAKFSESLTAQLEKGSIRHLNVDYGPDTVLRNALNAAEIRAEMGALPIKTTMYLDADKVSVRYGYSSPEETLWSSRASDKEGAPK